jgi:hypothetical protein
MSALLAQWIVEGYRWGSYSAPWYETLGIMFVVAVMTAGCVLIVKHLRHRDQQPKRVTDHWQALAVMGELCPRGWQAHITLYGQGAPVPHDAPPSRAPLVELEWKEFDGEPRQVMVARRAWARTIGGALQMMVDDRRTAMTLGTSEQAPDASGGLWGGD